ncbi:sucrase ferredoxin [Chroogloeocystis siderophila]|uniref:Sucrase ferredoxin n=1 Tax=Chroogloeocystis siderophila 5.2 s.c.1 TaxID=247279 RepID=A0A1U7HIK2_9CHRO|nr:sucrase ferredoxin [Chroogloeocystis siderophila]OKH23389.1 sucrase ferredoxin [Chroogloeocystis siderophila 5.2 s.c.1]
MKFCADASRQAGEDPIGWAGSHEIFVLIECPPPWSNNEFESKAAPANLSSFADELDQVEPSARVLLIHGEVLQHHTRLIMFRQSELANGYCKQEAQFSDIDAAVQNLPKYLADSNLGTDATPIRDILVCTHGSHDRCCGKYGYPFYRQALAIVRDLGLENVRVWQSSHFGGHRFAPTILDFPDGRCYGRLTPETFLSILTRQGDIHALKNVYRGWGILAGSEYPIASQVMERELMLQHGWDWFNCKIAYRIIEESADAVFSRVEFTVVKPDDSIQCYQADVVEDESRALYISGDCDGEVEKLPHRIVKNLVEV